jgi:hypothetical protein
LAHSPIEDVRIPARTHALRQQRRKLVSRLSGYYCLEKKVLLQAEAEL